MSENPIFSNDFSAIPYIIEGLPNTRLDLEMTINLQLSLLMMFGRGLPHHLRDITGYREFIPDQSLVIGDGIVSFTRELPDGKKLRSFQQPRSEAPSCKTFIEKLARKKWANTEVQPIGFIAIDVSQPQFPGPVRTPYIDDDSVCESRRGWGEIRRFDNGMFVYKLDRKAVKIIDGAITYYPKDDSIDVELEMI